MSPPGYWPTSPCVVATLGASWLAVLAGAFALGTRALPGERALGWGLVLGSCAWAHHASLHQPAGLRMLALIALVFTAMKGLLAVEARRQKGIHLCPRGFLAFALGWPGMDPAPFAATCAERPSRAIPGGLALLAIGAVELALGLGLLAGARAWLADGGARWVAVLLAMPGISLAMHFGAFDLAAGSWRLRGVALVPCFDAPLLSTSLHDFWSNRWNRPFIEMTRRAVYRPSAALVGRSGALIAGFVFSALLHEMAISLPVQAGYGGPFGYFVLHGVLMEYERRRHRSGAPPWPPWRARLWTAFWILAPLPWLFHPGFLDGCVLPLVGG